MKRILYHPIGKYVYIMHDGYIRNVSRDTVNIYFATINEVFLVQNYKVEVYKFAMFYSAFKNYLNFVVARSTLKLFR